jgi:FtsH-binding integral membrane protein
MPTEALSDLVVEHRESPRSRRLRVNRMRIALVLAALEGILVLSGAIPWWVVVLVALAAVVFYVYVRNEGRSELVQLAWIAAFANVLLLLVPVAATIVTALAIVLVVVFAVVALIALARDRR